MSAHEDHQTGHQLGPQPGHQPGPQASASGPRPGDASAPGRPRSFDPQRALESAMALFWERGFACASLQDLLRATGLSKSSLYQTFGSKRELFAHCIRHYSQSRAAQMREQLGAAPTALDFLRACFAEIAATGSAQARHGCLVMNTASEFAQSDADIAALVGDSLAGFRSVFREAVERARREGDIPADSDCAALADYLLSSVSGLRTMAKAGADRARLQTTADIVLRALG